ncbi:restriction endonuclease subunit S [Rhodanobacter denitrificans]|uniref:restriction endonuclease subunit S n=1 Tax=Rhodanobacter denitrificans TaxID=666685 RepID=UPI001F29AF87|nr:restriction endonuclease subunit S [Rhodanobacter denitrificans]UJJ57031.1 restriction endonuclease subunit S [Rhodanobacter denitrificans]
MKRNQLEAIGIFDDSFEFHTVSALVKAGVLERPIDGNHGEIHPKGEDFVVSGVPFLMASDIDNGVVDYQSCKFITAKQADGLRKGFAKNGDVLLTHKATIGRTAIVDYHEHPYVMLTPQVTYYRVRDKQRLSNRYLRHYFESGFFQAVLNQWAGGGATRAYLGITEQGKLPVVLPPHGKQQKLAAVLSAYDDLIENNRRRITLLERMAEQLYREWFVRFRFPGYAQAKFEKGHPADWKSSTLGKIATFVMGQSPSSEFYNDIGNGLPFHQGVGTYGDQFPNHVTFCSVDGRRAKEGDVLFSVRAPVGRLNIADCDMIIGRGLAAINHKQGFNAYLFNLLKVAFANEDIIGNGAIFNSVGKDELSRFPVFSPPSSLVKRFDEMASAIETQIEVLSTSIRNLIKTRDLLLPRLISGKLRVDELDIRFPPSMQAG